MDSKKKKGTKQTQKTKKTSENKYRSKLEESVAQDLENKKVSYMYEWDWINYTVTRKYKPDFLLPNQIHVEVKGYFRSADQRKHRAIKKQHPEIDLRFVFQNVNARVQGSQMTCAEWCNKYNFLYAEGVIPKQWIKERNKQQSERNARQNVTRRKRRQQ